MTELHDPVLKRFIGQIRASKSIDFPALALSQGVNWFDDLRPLLKVEPAFKAAMQEALLEIKYSLLQGILEVAQEGKPRNGVFSEITYVNAIIKLIDSGVVLGMDKEEKPEEPADMNAIDDLLKRINRNDSKKND